MPSYVITGASRGLGYAFLQHLSRDSSNVVIGLVRNKAATDEKVQKDGLKNVHIIQADVVDIPALKKAAEETTQLTGGSLDVLINNAAFISDTSAFANMSQAEKDLDTTLSEFKTSFEVNVLGTINTVTAFLPLIRRSAIKKVISMTTGMADLPLVNKFSVGVATPYTVSKAALNALVAKYNAAYSKEGILFLGISPGVVATSRSYTNMSEEDVKGFQEMLAQFKVYAPHFEGPITPKESVEAVMGVVERASVEEGWGGGFVSQFGDQNWL